MSSGLKMSMSGLALPASSLRIKNGPSAAVIWKENRLFRPKIHVQKIRAACDARIDKNTVIMARTDTRAINGVDDAIRRGHLYADAGAEILFIEALRDREEVERLAREFEGTGTYLFANMIEAEKRRLFRPLN